MAQIDSRIPLMVQAPQIEPYQNALARSLQARALQGRVAAQEQEISDTNALRQAAMGGKLFTPDGMLAPNALDVVGRMAPGSLPQFAQLAATQQQTQRKNRIQDAEFNMKRQEWLKTGLSSVKSPQEALAYIQSGVQSGLVDPGEAQQWSAQVPQDPGQFNTWITGLNRQLMTPQQRYEAGQKGVTPVGAPFEATGPDGRPALVQRYGDGSLKPVEGFTPKARNSGLSITTNPDGTVSVTQGGPNIKLTEGQSKDLVYLTRGEAAMNTLDSLGSTLADPAQRTLGATPVVGNLLTGSDFQRADQAGREFLAAVLRKDTGAAITGQEMDIYGKMYLPQPGDSPEVLQQKAESRRIALDAIRNGLGTATPLAPERNQRGEKTDQGASARPSLADIFGN